MKTKEEILKQVTDLEIKPDMNILCDPNEFYECMIRWADQEKAALKEKIIKSCNEAIDMEMESVGTEFPVVEAYKNVIELIESL